MKINTLILGKSGVGKSSLLNYLWGDAIAKVGTGRPVTPRSDGSRIGLYEHAPVGINGHQLVIFDSWGLEADQAERWTKTVTDEINKREEKANLEEWFHAVIYCISAAGARIEPFEISKVLKPLAEQGQAITFALTKADIASEEEILAIKKEINTAYPNNGGIIEICSEGKKLRNGTTTQPRGKEELFTTLTQNLAKKLRTKLAKKHVIRSKEAAYEWKKIALSLYDKEASFFQSTGTTLQKIIDPIRFELDVKLGETNRWMQNSLDKIETLEGAFRKITNLPLQHRVSSLDVFPPEKIQWTPLDHAAAFAKYLIPLFNVYHTFTATSKYRDELSEKLDETIAEIMMKIRQGASERLLAIKEIPPPHVIKTSTSTRDDISIQIRNALSGKYSGRY